jgi:hypothetical protein
VSIPRDEKVVGPGHGLVRDRIEDGLDSVLTSIFAEGGKRTVLYYMTEEYNLTLEQASRNPGKLEEALTNLLGEIGWTVVKRRILEQFLGQGGTGTRGVETASLRDAFGLA